MAHHEARARAKDVHRAVTNQILAAIEAGAQTFEMPWHRDGAKLRPANARTGHAYQGVNLVSLWAAAQLSGFASHLWATYRQWQALGAQVRREEKGSVIVFYKEVEREIVERRTGGTRKETRLFARASFVFNADQIEGWSPPRNNGRGSAEVITRVEAFVAQTAADIRHMGVDAFYNPLSDFIQLPERERFVDSSTSTATEAYYATLLHELAHWSGHGSRLDRDLSSRFGDDAYAMEELVAELGAAFLCADLGITNEPRPDHAAYVIDWLAVLEGDRKAIFTAASKATNAAEYLQSLQPQSQGA